MRISDWSSDVCSSDLVNQLEITTPGEAPRKLTLDQRDALILELRGRKERSFDALAKRLKLQPGESFNKASETRKMLRGNEVHAALADKKRFGDAWAHQSPEQQWAIIDRLLEEENPDTLTPFTPGHTAPAEQHTQPDA